MRRGSKEDAIRIITSCAEQYRDELAGRTLLFVCSSKKKDVVCFEFSFYPWNFMHLTGVKVPRNGIASSENSSEIAATDFYNRCLAHRLSPRDFEFAGDGTTQLKLDVLGAVLNKNLSAKMVGDYDSAKPKLYTEKLVGGTKACVGFVIDQTSGRYVPNTVLKEDIRNYVGDYRRVIAVYRKKTGEERYMETTYRVKDVDWSNIRLPDQYDYLREMYLSSQEPELTVLTPGKDGDTVPDAE